MMKIASRTGLFMATVLLGACADPSGPRAPLSRFDPTASAEWVEGQPVWQSDYLARGGSLTGTQDPNAVTAYFDASLTTFTASAAVSYLHVTNEDAALSASIVNTEGNLVNSGVKTWSRQSTIPRLSVATIPLTITISTNNNRCGITGRARLESNASLRLLVTKADYTQVWSGRIDRTASDVTLPPCTNEEDRFVASGCPEQIVYAPEECTGGGGGSGSVGGGLLEDNCEWWVRIVSYSLDGGQTWHEESRTYYQVCS